MPGILYCLILLVAVCQLHAQSIRKTIFIKDSESKASLQGVAVTARGFREVSDAKGCVVITAVPGDTVVFYHLGSKRGLYPFVLLSDGQTIFLAPAPVVVQDVLITGNRNITNTFSERIAVPQNMSLVYEDAAALLRTRSTFLIKDYGGAGAAKTITARGMSSENTVVLFNEARISDLRNGTFDLRKLSLDNIESIDIDKAGGEGPFSGSGGVVKITSGNFSETSKIKFSARYEADGLQSYFSSIKGLVPGGFYYSASAERTFSPNEFRYSFEGKEYQRKSASFNKTSAGFDFRYTARALVFKNHFHYSYMNSGVPGAVVSNNDGHTNVANLSESFLDVLNVTFPVSKKIFIENTAAFNSDRFIIDDPDKILFYPFDKKKSVLYDYQVINKASYKNGGICFSAGNYIQSSLLKDMSNINLLFNVSEKYERILERVFLSCEYADTGRVLFVKNIRGYGSSAYSILNETVDKKYSEGFSTFRLGLSFQPDILLPVTIHADYSNESREPSYCERFYSGLYRFGTTFLNNENYRCLNLGCSIDVGQDGKTILDLIYYFIKADDKIIWFPVSILPGMQTPRNIGKVESSGMEMILRKEFTGNISITGGYVYNKALNKNYLFHNDNSYNKQLVYTPVHRFNYTVTYSPACFNFCLSGNYADKSYYSSDNNRFSILKAYFTSDFSASYKFKIKKAALTAGVNIYNIFDTEYMIIQSYPMPLRNYSFTINMEIQ